MTLIESPHHVKHHRMLTLRQHLELAHSDNQQLKQSLDKHKEQRRRDLDYFEKKLKECLKENDTLYSTQQRLTSELYAKDLHLDASNKEVLYWKRLYNDLDKTMCIERQEFARQQDLWLHRDSQQTFRLCRLQDSHLKTMRTTSSAPYLPPYDNTPISGEGSLLHSDIHVDPSHQSQSQPISPITIPQVSDLQTVPSLQKKVAHVGLEFEQQQIQTKQVYSAQLSCPMDQVRSIKQLSPSSSGNNGTYQLPSLEKALSEDCLSDSFVQVRSNDISPKCLGPTEPQDRLSLEKRQHSTTGRPPLSRQARKRSLEYDPSMANMSEQTLHLFSGAMLDKITALEDANQALQRYINKILMRIMNDSHMESILSIDPPVVTATFIINSSTLTRNTQCATSQSPSQEVEPWPNRLLQNLESSTPLKIYERFSGVAS